MNGSGSVSGLTCVSYITLMSSLIQYQLQMIFNFSYHIYKLSFLNFLLGRQPNGPGQFMFGTIQWGDNTTWLEGVEVKGVSQDVR